MFSLISCICDNLVTGNGVGFMGDGVALGECIATVSDYIGGVIEICCFNNVTMQWAVLVVVYLKFKKGAIYGVRLFNMDNISPNNF